MNLEKNNGQTTSEGSPLPFRVTTTLVTPLQPDIRTLKQNYCVVMIGLCPRQAWWSLVHAPLRTVEQKCPTP